MPKKTNEKFGKLKELIASIIIEQATCERSGHAWGEEKLDELDVVIKELAKRGLTK